MGHFHIHSEVIAEEAVHVSVVLNIFIMFISALQLVKVPIFHLESGFILRTVFSVTVPFCIVLGNMGLNILLLVHFRKYLYLCSGIIIGVLIYFILGNIPAELFFSLIYIYSIRQLNIRFQKLMFYGILLLFLIELFSLINWVIFIPLGVISIFNQVAVVEEQFYYLFSLFSPFFVILFLFGWVQNYGIGPFFCDSGVHKKLKRKRLMDFPKIIKPRHIFLIAIILSIVVPMYPYLSTINPTQKAVSPDMVFRAGVVDAVRTDWTNIFREMGGSRPLYLLVVFILQLLLRLESVSFVMYSTILFIALLIMSMYYFVSRSLNNNDFAILSAFLLSTGVNVVIGIFLYNISRGFRLTLFSPGRCESQLN